MFRALSTYVLLLCFSNVNSQSTDPRVLSILDTIQHPIEQIEALHGLAQQIRKTERDLSESIAKQVLELSTTSDYEIGIGHGNYDIGAIYVYEDFPKSLNHLIRAESIYDSSAFLQGLANVKLSLAALYHGIGERTPAVRYAKEAEQITKQTGDIKTLSRVHTNLTAIYHYFDQIDSALYHGKIALDLKREIQDTYGIRLMLLNLGVVKANFDSLLEEGLDHLLEARSISSDPVMITDITTNIAYAYLRMREYNKAQLYLDSSIVSSDTIENDYTLQGLHRIGKDMALELSDYATAFGHLEQEFELDKKLRGEEVQEEIEVLQLENENAEKEKQILILEKQKAETNFRYILLSILSVSAVLMGILIYLVMRYRVRASKLKQKELQLDLDHKNRELASYTVNFVQKNELISNIREEVNQLKKSIPGSATEVKKINRIIDDSTRVDNEWEDFKLRFEEVHEGFFKTLSQKFPDLGNAEVKLCALLRLNMNLKESAQILGISADSVKTARYRIRKKMGLSTEDNLVQYITLIT